MATPAVEQHAPQDMACLLLHSSGTMVHSYTQLAMPCLAGIAWDAIKKRLFVTGKYWPAIFEVELVDFAPGMEPSYDEVAQKCLAPNQRGARRAIHLVTVSRHADRAFVCQVSGQHRTAWRTTSRQAGSKETRAAAAASAPAQAGGRTLPPTCACTGTLTAAQGGRCCTASWALPRHAAAPPPRTAAPAQRSATASCWKRWQARRRACQALASCVRGWHRARASMQYGVKAVLTWCTGCSQELRGSPCRGG
eukprot:354857-Chlamydomonas_euryale.AAC.9